MPAYPALIWGGDDGISNSSVLNYIDLAHLSLGEPESVNIENGRIDITKSFIVATAGTTGITNQIWRIEGGEAGSIIVLRCATSTTLRDNTANLRLSGDYLMDTGSDTMVLIRLASDGNWLQLARANNG